MLFLGFIVLMLRLVVHVNVKLEFRLHLESSNLHTYTEFNGLICYFILDIHTLVVTSFARSHEQEKREKKNRKFVLKCRNT